MERGQATPGFGITPLVPAYGRDYKSQAALKTDWEDEKDFLTVGGNLVNRQQFKPGCSVEIRYEFLQEVVVVTS